MSTSVKEPQVVSTDKMLITAITAIDDGQVCGAEYVAMDVNRCYDEIAWRKRLPARAWQRGMINDYQKMVKASLARFSAEDQELILEIAASGLNWADWRRVNS